MISQILIFLLDTLLGLFPLARWNRSAFQLLYLLFQMTVTDLPRSGVPSITIAK